MSTLDDNADIQPDDGYPFTQTSQLANPGPPPRTKAILKPPMGWNSWNWIGCNEALMNETTIREVVDAIVSTGLSDVGYKYINLDDCWMKKEKRRPGVPLTPDPKRFPSGMRSLGRYIHSKGLKFGIYGDCGTLTCQGDPGSLGNEVLDAKTFVEWGVDYLKLDGCYASVNQMKKVYTDWSWALYNEANASGKNIVFSCSWPAYALGGEKVKDFDWSYISKICDLWRVYGDASAKYESVEDIAQWFAKNQDVLRPWSGPGSYNDADMLEIGNGLTEAEERTQMNLWAVLGSPLIMGHDIRSEADHTLHALKAKEVIDVNQDKDGKQGGFIGVVDLDLNLWVRDLSEGKKAVVWWNRKEEAVKGKLRVEWSVLGVPESWSCSARNPWTGVDLGLYIRNFITDTEIEIPKHGSVMIVLTPLSASSSSSLTSPRGPATIQRSFLGKSARRNRGEVA